MARERAVRRGDRVIVAAAGGNAAAGEELLQRRAHEHEAAFVLRQIDQRALAGLPTADDAGERGRGTKQ